MTTKMSYILTGLVATLGAASALSAAVEPELSSPPTPATLRILSDTTLPSDFQWASDVRWASDKSVYLGVAVDGTFEISLDPTGPPPKEMIPGRSMLRGFWASEHLAASSQYLAAAGPARAVTWRRLENAEREEAPFDFIQGLDIQESRLAILGGRRDEKGGYGADGAIAWIGSLDKKLADLRPVLYDTAGQGTPNMRRCGSLPAGALRFLPEGSLLVVPGVQPGASLYDRGGTLICTWPNKSLGIDSICADLTDDDQAHGIMDSAASRNPWLNRWRTVDTLLPLAGGPGLVVRKAENGHTRWELKILKLDGTAESFVLPFEGSSEFFHLEGDVRAGKLVFLLYETVFEGGEKNRPTPPRLIVAEPAWPEVKMATHEVRVPGFVVGRGPFPNGEAPAAAAPSPSPPKRVSNTATSAALGIVSDLDLPRALEWASDVRWASDNSVYLGVGFVGTFEVSLDPAGPPPKEIIAGRAKPGGFWASLQIASSSRYLAAAGPAMVVTWRRLENPVREEAPFDFIQGIDVLENRFAILGGRRDEQGGYGTDGAIAWIGTLDKKLTDLRPVLYDIAGPGTRNMGRCGSAPVGALRFLPGGSLLVVPGVQPGISLYDSSGRLIRTWDTPSLGIDSTCGSMNDDEQAHRIMGPAASRNIWLNQWRTVETILPLPGGPGLVVRNAGNGHTRWDLRILKPDGTTESFALPFEGSSEFFHLKGDVRAGKIVFLLSETVFNGGERNRPTPPRLIVAETLAYPSR